MSEKQEQSCIFIELDALLDTRLATLAQFSDEVVKSNVLNGYHDRTIDFFQGVSEKDYQKKYSERNKTYLKNAVITPMALFVKQFIAQTIQNSINSPYKMEPKVIVNTYPYDLTDDEAEVIIEALKQVILGMSDIQLVHMSNEEITPSYVKNNLSMLVMYEFHKWIDLHCANENFKKISCPEIGLIGPRVLFSKPSPNIRIDRDPFDAFETLAEPLIRLSLLPAEHFSSMIRPKRKEA